MGTRFRILDRVAIEGRENVFTVIETPTPLARNVRVADASGVLDFVNMNRCTLVSRASVQKSSDLLKMYVLVKNTVPVGLGINGVGHVTYKACKTFNSKIHSKWESESNRQVTCLVSEDEYYEAIEQIKEVGGAFVEFNENDWQDQDITVAFEARYNWPDIFRTLKLHPGLV